MFQKIIFTFLSFLVLYSCKRVDDKPTTKNELSEELKVEIIKEEIIEDPKNDLKLTDENIIEFLYEYEKNNKENKVRIYTDFGQIEILLYDNTPYHRSNFIFLAKKKYFEGMEPNTTQNYNTVNNVSTNNMAKSDAILPHMSNKNTDKTVIDIQDVF